MYAFRVWTFRSMSIVSSGKVHFKNLKMRSHCVDNSQAILEVSLKLFILVLGNCYLPMETKSYLALA